ncbi:UNVERIFIED_CONTAM: hypothetical protein FKN15_023649 [Acipenser sinensis]
MGAGETLCKQRGMAGAGHSHWKQQGRGGAPERRRLCGLVRIPKCWVKVPDADAHQTPEKVLVDIDSRTVAMEVGIR